MTSLSEEMQRPFEWMMHADVYILDLFHTHEIVLTPIVISIELDYERSYVQNRIAALTQAELLEREGSARGVYQITERGKRFIDDELTEEEVEELRQFGQPDDIEE